MDNSRPAITIEELQDPERIIYWMRQALLDVYFTHLLQETQWEKFYRELLIRISQENPIKNKS